MSELRERASNITGRAKRERKREEAEKRQARYKALSLREKFARAITADGNSGRELAKLNQKALKLSEEDQTTLREGLVSDLADFMITKQLDTVLRF